MHVQPHHRPDVVSMLTEQPQHLFSQGSSGNALDGAIGLIRVDRQQCRPLGDGGMVYGAQRFGRVAASGV